MIDKRTPEAIQSQEEQTRKFFLKAGTVYGLLLGLGFALFTWGYDALLLASSSADLAWARLLWGLPLAVISGGLVGRLAAHGASAGISAALWAAAGALWGVLAGHMPFDGGNLAAWLTDRRLWGAVIFPYCHSAEVRTVLIVIISAFLGLIVGFFQSQAQEWVWDRATPEGRMSRESWIVLCLCISLALPLAGTVEGLLNRPLRHPQQKVAELIELSIAGAQDAAEAQGISYRAAAPFRAAFSEQYVTHLVEYDPETLYSAYVDVAFDNGFVLRCVTLGEHVAYCDDFSKKFADWMDNLIHAGLTGEHRWLDAPVRRLQVDDTVTAWLTEPRGQLEGDYEVSRTGQRGGWILMSARFASGFEMHCHFRGAAPIRVDQCHE